MKIDIDMQFQGWEIALIILAYYLLKWIFSWLIHWMEKDNRRED